MKNHHYIAQRCSQHHTQRKKFHMNLLGKDIGGMFVANLLRMWRHPNDLSPLSPAAQGTRNAGSCLHRLPAFAVLGHTVVMAPKSETVGTLGLGRRLRPWQPTPPKGNPSRSMLQEAGYPSMGNVRHGEYKLRAASLRFGLWWFWRVGHAGYADRHDRHDRRQSSQK